MHEKFEIGSFTGMSKEKFIETYTKVNDSLWDRYNQGQIEREYLRKERFRIVLKKCGTEDVSRSDEMSDYYIKHCPRQKGLVEDADIILNYLSKKYKMSLITNGFEDIQQVKVKSTGLDRYFEKMYTSEAVGAKKPDPKIFEYALTDQSLEPHEVVMIGDNLKTDIKGALGVNITPIFFNPLGVVKSDCEWQISRLQELMKIL